MGSLSQHIGAATLLAVVYYITQGRVTVVLLLAFAYFFYAKELSKIPTTDQASQKPTQEQTDEHKHHKHKGGSGGCGKLCTCKDKKNAPKKKLSSLKAKKGFGSKALAVEDDKSVAVDFTTVFARA